MRAALLARLTENLRGQPLRKGTLYYLSQLFMLASPIIVLPYLGRVVGPAGIGLYGSGQGLAVILTAVVEFNMVQSASRHAARIREQPHELHELVVGVLGAKLMLTALALVVCAALFFTISIMRNNPLVFAMAMLFGIVQGHSLYWFFGGIGKLEFVAFTDVLGRGMGVIATFAFVHSPSQLWLTFVAQALGAGIGISVALVYLTTRFHEPIWPNFRAGVDFMKRGGHLFAQSLIGTLYTGSTALIMGLTGTAITIGYLAAAERLVRAGVLLSTPLRQTFFPSVTAMVQTNTEEAARLVRRLLLSAGGINLCISLLLLIASGPIIRVVFGKGFEDSVAVLRVISIMPVLLVVQDVVGTLWLIPHHQDRYCTFVVITAGTLHVIGVAVLTYFWGAMGAAVAMLASNVTASILLVGKAITLPAHPLFRAEFGRS